MYHALNMARRPEAVKVQNTHDYDRLASALLDLVSFLNSPQRDEELLREAEVTLDRALFPLLVRIGMQVALPVVALADQVGRDYTTVSRQLAKLETLGLIERSEGASDRRTRAQRLTATGTAMVHAIAEARRRALAAALAGWSVTDRQRLTDLNRRFADSLLTLAQRRQDGCD